ncbi:MAG: CRISPR-associated RAMP protein [Candidatus Brockarchaeota archaeon]|nr:CRISPR-associated RAMP protein [Candidatus Brockarchaeota archaeon]
MLLRETILEGYLTNISPLRIGSGREPPLGATVDLAVLRILYEGKLVPYIPGSSLKGVFRSQATAIAKSVGLDVCTGLSKETCMDLKKIRDPDLGEQKLGDYVDLKLRHGDSKNAMKSFWENACLMCKVFGSPGYAGKLYFSDAYPIDKDGTLLSIRLGTRTGIAIDRRTGAVMERALYTVEYVEPGARFRFNIRCKNLPNYVLGLIGVILRVSNQGQIRIGGFKTRGFGEVRIEDLKFRNKDAHQIDTRLRSLEDGVDSEVDLQDLVKIEEAWQVAEGDDVWKILEKLEEAWKVASSKGSSY